MKEVKIAVLGLGFMGGRRARILSQLPEAVLLAVADPNEQRAAEYASALGVPAYRDAAVLIASHPDLDALVIATPDEHHLEPVIMAAEAGLHMLVEKPVADSPKKAQQIVDLTHKAGLTLMVGHSLRFDPRYTQMKESIEKGAIGELVHLYARRNGNTAIAGRIGGRVSGAYWVGVHDIDVMHWITKAKIAKVVAKQVRKKLAQTLGVEDCILALLTFENGVVAMLEDSWVTPPMPGRPMSLLFEARGAEGVIDVAAYEQGITIHTPANVLNPDTLYSPTIHGRICGVYRDETAHFVECVARQTVPAVTGEDGLAAVFVADAIERSLSQDCEVAV